MAVIVIGNGPSSIKYTTENLGNHALIGCNSAYQDYDLNHLVVRDQLAVEQISQQDGLPKKCWSTPRWIIEQGLEATWSVLPDTIKLSNAGACAIMLADFLYPKQQVFCIGFDLVMHLKASTTRYDYPHMKDTKRNKAKAKYQRDRVDRAVEACKTTQPLFVNDQTIEGLPTINTSVFEKEILGWSNTSDSEEQDFQTGGGELKVTPIPSEDTSLTDG